jgi:predicted Zn-dependent protease with MMP-like domain
MMDERDEATGNAPDLDAIEAVALHTIANLPSAFRTHAQNVQLRVSEFAPEDVLRDLRIDDPFQLTGLYEGVPLTEKSANDVPGPPDTIWLFRRPILDEWIARGNVRLTDLVAHVLIHELAHHFGWSDEEILQIDRWWE